MSGGEGGIVRLTALRDPDFPNRFLVLRGHERAASRHASSDDGRWFVTAAGPNIHLWDLTAEAPERVPVLLNGHRGVISGMAFNAAGSLLVTASRDWTVRLWDLRDDALEAAARILAGRNLTHTEWNSYFPEQEYRETFPSFERT